MGSAENVQYDQELESVMVGPVPVGVNKFVLQVMDLFIFRKLLSFPFPFFLFFFLIKRNNEDHSGTDHFVLTTGAQTDPPDHTKIPEADVLGVTVVLLKCYYRNSEFLRVGFYVNNEYETPELQDSPPSPHDVTKIVRNILAAKPRITTFPNRWDNLTPEIEEIEQTAISEGPIAFEVGPDAEDDEEGYGEEEEEEDDDEEGEGDEEEGDEDDEDENDVINMES